MQQRGRVYAAILVQVNMPRLRGQVAGGTLRQALLEAAGRLVEQRPRVLLAYSRVEGLQDLLQADALSAVQRELRAGGAGALLAHHRANHPETDHPSLPY